MTVDERKSINTGVIQNLILENRGKLSISGVNDVLSFDDQVVMVETELGLLTVKGENIRINKLSIDTSEVIIGAIKRNLGIGYVIKDLVTDDIKRGLLKEIPIPNLPKIGISLVYIKDYITASPKLFLNKYYNIEI